MNPFFQKWIAEQEEELDKLAHALANGKTYDEYLIGVGKYRKGRADLARLQDRLKRADISEEEAFGDEPEPEPETRSSTSRPQQKRRSNFRATRSWGGN